MSRLLDEIAVTKVPKGLQNIEVKCRQPIPVPYPEHLFRLHSIMVFCGPRGSGKTNTATLLLNEYRRCGYFNRIFIISPTYDSNPTIQTIKAEPEDIYRDHNRGRAALLDIERKVKEAAAIFTAENDYRKIYNRWLGGKSNLRDMIILQRRNYKPPKNIPVPYCCLLVDDMSHTDIYSSGADNPMINLTLRHRHLGGNEEYKVGISLMFLVQNFKTGVPKVIRENTQVFCLWKTMDKKLLEDIQEQLGTIVSKEQFMAMYSYAADEQNNFFTIEPFRPEEDKRFRKNLNEYLNPKHRLSMVELILKDSQKRKLLHGSEFDDSHTTKSSDNVEVDEPRKKVKAKRKRASKSSVEVDSNSKPS